jgi:ubiquitin thioesterase protein OTUB1
MAEQQPANNDSTTNDNNNTHATQVQQTQAQIEAIEQEIRENQALTSELQDIQNLKLLYKSDDSSKYFALGIDALSENYSKLRTIRGDGNCYYRAFLYQLSEKLRDNKDEWDRIFKLGT